MAPVERLGRRTALPEQRVKSAPVVLVVDEDADVMDTVSRHLGEDGYDVVTVSEGQAALDLLYTRDVEVVLLDLEIPKVSGLSILAALPSLHTDAKFIVMTAHGTVGSAVEAMKLGAYDYVEKPFDPDELLHIVDRASADLEARRELRRLRGASGVPRMRSIVGRTPAMQRVFRLIERVAPTRATVLITGETGTGKELVARAVHELSPRSNKPFVAVNCSAIPGTLLEAELFGHMRGSFTGAVQSRKGLIEEAAGGTLFLDEISTLSEDVQVKLLRVLEDRRVQRVGSNTPVPVDFRLIAATNTDLRQLVTEGRLREDLFFRLDVFPIGVPPLRERADDIPLLTSHFTARFAEEHEVLPPRVSPPTLSRMMAYDWPGNVRELENFIERSVIMYPGVEGFPFDLPHAAAAHEGARALSHALDGDWTLERLEREYLLSTLERSRWQQSVAAEILGINRRTIHRKLKRYREEGVLPQVPADGSASGGEP
jgi:DNA-binding NtrC family response regulator